MNHSQFFATMAHKCCMQLYAWDKAKVDAFNNEYYTLTFIDVISTDIFLDGALNISYFYGLKVGLFKNGSKSI